MHKCTTVSLYYFVATDVIIVCDLRKVVSLILDTNDCLLSREEARGEETCVKEICGKSDIYVR